MPVSLCLLISGMLFMCPEHLKGALWQEANSCSCRTMLLYPSDYTQWMYHTWHGTCCTVLDGMLAQCPVLSVGYTVLCVTDCSVIRQWPLAVPFFNLSFDVLLKPLQLQSNEQQHTNSHHSALLYVTHTAALLACYTVPLSISTNPTTWLRGCGNLKTRTDLSAFYFSLTYLSLKMYVLVWLTISYWIYSSDPHVL
jgi:hypothetical protein